MENIMKRFYMALHKADKEGRGMKINKHVVRVMADFFSEQINSAIFNHPGCGHEKEKSNEQER
jgi:hypothetical protein